MNIQKITYDWAWNPGARKVTKFLILHHSAGSGGPEDIHRIHRARGWAGIGYHYYVRRDGSVYTGRSENMVGTHTAGHNHDSIGVCFEGNFERESMNDAQFAAGAELLADILERFPGLKIQGHRDLYATACPGRHFPFEKMKEESKMTKLTQEEFDRMADNWLLSLGKRAPGDWSAEARAWAQAQGIIQGDGTGNYQYGKPLTREEYVAMEYRQRGVEK